MTRRPTPGPSLGDALLIQNGGSGGAAPGAVDAELANLRRIVDAEHRRARTLARCTQLVWLAATAMLLVPLLSVFIYTGLRVANPPDARPTGAATQPVTAATTAPAGDLETRRTSAPSPADAAAKALLVTLLMLSLPLAAALVALAVVLQVMTFVARRTAGMHEIRASLASIDAQLRLLAMTEKPRGEGGQAGKP